MALPSNYRQNAMASPVNVGSSTPSHLLNTSLGMSPSFNILKERLRPSGSSLSMKDSNQSPFVQSPHGHPQFNPQRLGGKFTGDSRALKPPKAPEKPLMPYMRYSRKVWDEVKAANQDLKLWEIGKIIGQMWRDLPDIEKQEFVDEYEAEKAEYDRLLKSYHSSPAYQAYIAAKSKGQQGTDDKDSMDRNSGSKGALERRIEIQPAEDEEDIDDGWSVKHVAHARFVRNHRLVHEIFSDVVVPDVRSVVTTARMQVLKRQVHSLTMHQKKLETELQQIEEKFEAKKKKFVESSTAFQDELQRISRKPIDEETFQSLVETQMEQLKKEKEKEEERAAELEKQKQESAAEDSNEQNASDADKPEGTNEKKPAVEASKDSAEEAMDVDQVKQEPEGPKTAAAVPDTASALDSDNSSSVPVALETADTPAAPSAAPVPVENQESLSADDMGKTEQGETQELQVSVDTAAKQA